MEFDLSWLYQVVLIPNFVSQTEVVRHRKCLQVQKLECTFQAKKRIWEVPQRRSEDRFISLSDMVLFALEEASEYQNFPILTENQYYIREQFGFSQVVK